MASDGGFRLTYSDLDVWSNRLARMLLRRGVGPGCLVAIAAVPGFEAVAVRYALVKLGATAWRVRDGMFTPAATAGVTVRDRHPGSSDSVRWLVLDDRAALREYLSTSGAPLTAAESGMHRHAG
ncbi:AMP-binding protein [Nocardia inohanensis]|uniref:AMP-binding protein n=1 Tax=Nocardia inohanensis TaxID=209246 RepID=UPI00147086EC|nr:AMP-binding protein [Nocardia inohanensis]